MHRACCSSREQLLRGIFEVSIATDFELIIEPGRAHRRYWRDLWRYRELFYFLSWRDILVRYKQTVLGVSWSVIRPLLTMIVFTIVFGRIAKLPHAGVPYALLVYAGLLPWNFMSTALTEMSASLTSNTNLLTKVYFPRLVIPASALITSFVDLLISFVILLCVMGVYRFMPPWHMVLLPLAAVLAVVATAGCGLLFCALNVTYRDFRYVVPFIVQFGVYISPVGFGSDVIPAKWRLLYSINPAVGVIDAFRWCLLGRPGDLYLPGFLLSTAVSFVLLWYGLMIFRRTEREFADVV